MTRRYPFHFFVHRFWVIDEQDGDSSDGIYQDTKEETIKTVSLYQAIEIMKKRIVLKNREALNYPESWTTESGTAKAVEQYRWELVKHAPREARWPLDIQMSLMSVF